MEQLLTDLDKVCMDPSLASEILGDWNNLKGTEYHFAYALCRLLQDPDLIIEFYRGNDLLAHVVPPPHPTDTQPGAHAMRIKGQLRDEWIQLKATAAPWTRSELLKDNLLLIFICNALVSEAHGR